MGGHGGGGITVGPRSCCPLVAGGLPSLGAVAGGGILEVGGVGCGGTIGSLGTGSIAAATAAAAAAATAAFDDLSEALVVGGGVNALVSLSDRGAFFAMRVGTTTLGTTTFFFFSLAMVFLKASVE